jgi:hypothetical protein
MIKFNIMQLKDIIILLIKDNLVNTRLLKGMNDLGFYSDHYHLNLSSAIFNLIGISDEQDELFEVYLEWCSKASQREIFTNPKLLDEYANEIYLVLLEEVNAKN